MSLADLGSLVTLEIRVLAPAHQLPHSGRAQGEVLQRRPLGQNQAHRGLLVLADARCAHDGRAGRCLTEMIGFVGHMRRAALRYASQIRWSVQRRASAVQRLHLGMEQGQGSLVKLRLVVDLVRREQEAYAGMGQRK